MKRKDQMKQITKDYFDSTASQYDSSFDGKFVRGMYQAVLNRVLALKPEVVLDLGCGNGTILLQMKDYGVSLYGVDLSSNMVQEARKRLGESAEVRVGDAAELPYSDNQFDLVICNASFHHYPEPDQCLEEIRRVLKPEGTLVLGDPTAPSGIIKPLNWLLHQGRTGDFHIYGKNEICGLLTAHGFCVTYWEKINYKSFVLTARKDAVIQ